MGTRRRCASEAKGREMIGVSGSYELRESASAYRDISGHKNADLRPENEYYWKDIVSISA